VVAEPAARAKRRDDLSAAAEATRLLVAMGAAAGLTPEAVARLSAAEQAELLALLEDREKLLSQGTYYALFPDHDTLWTGPDTVVLRRNALVHARSGYARHVEWFAAGAEYRERCLMAANRVGKSVAGAYEMAAHLTGQYPAWWAGRRFSRPVLAWACGKTTETARGIVQRHLLGDVVGLANAAGEGSEAARKGLDGRGVIPGHLIGPVTWRGGVADAVDTVLVRHVSGGWSRLGVKSYEQGRSAYEGTAIDAIWMDEEPPLDVYGECLVRTTTTDGIIFLTFTPLAGISDVVRQFCGDAGMAA